MCGDDDWCLFDFRVLQRIGTAKGGGDVPYSNCMAVGVSARLCVTILGLETHHGTARDEYEWTHAGFLGYLGTLTKFL